MSSVWKEGCNQPQTLQQAMSESMQGNTDRVHMLPLVAQVEQRIGGLGSRGRLRPGRQQQDERAHAPLAERLARGGLARQHLERLQRRGADTVIMQSSREQHSCAGRQSSPKCAREPHAGGHARGLPVLRSACNLQKCCWNCMYERCYTVCTQCEISFVSN